MKTPEPDSTREATEILVKIIYSTHAKADLKKVAANEHHINAKEITQVLKILEYLEDLFDGTLGEWGIDPVDLELKSGSKLFDSKYYMVPRINKETFTKDLKCLVEIGVLTMVQQSQYITPVFIIPKKEFNLRFITDYRRLNQKLARKTYTSPRIGKTMQQLEGLQYTTELDLNMGYYTISLSPTSQDTTTIVTEFVYFVLPTHVIFLQQYTG